MLSVALPGGCGGVFLVEVGGGSVVGLCWCGGCGVYIRGCGEYLKLWWRN